MAVLYLVSQSVSQSATNEIRCNAQKYGYGTVKIVILYFKLSSYHSGTRTVKIVSSVPVPVTSG